MKLSEVKQSYERNKKIFKMEKKYYNPLVGNIFYILRLKNVFLFRNCQTHSRNESGKVGRRTYNIFDLKC